jgi:transposase InsO family protein
MQNRRLLAEAVLSGEATISEAARRYGVTRPTAYTWVRRAFAEGIPALQEHGRRPQHIARQTDVDIEALVLAQKNARPAWGAKKIHAELWPKPLAAPVCVRTVDRLLARHGLVQQRTAEPEASSRFERSGCNELWQMDFKGIARSVCYTPLTVLDDCSRFLIGLEPLHSRSTETVWESLWAIFGEYGLPECILTDNGDGFNSTRSEGPTLFQARLWRLGVCTANGRPRHPQTQGKVERFHRTLEDEYADRLVWPSAELARKAWQHIIDDYNWNRPHEALDMRTPGSRYSPSARKRPATLPPAHLPDSAIKRKVDAYGKFSFRNRVIRAGRGLAGEWVEIREEESGFALYYANVRVNDLYTLQV